MEKSFGNNNVADQVYLQWTICSVYCIFNMPQNWVALHLAHRVFYLTFMNPCIVIIFQYISNKMQRYTAYFIWKLLYIFRVVPSPTIRSTNNCIYGIWYLSHRYCYLLLSLKSWNWFECAAGDVRHPQDTNVLASISSTIAAGSSIGLTIPDAVHTVLYSW